MKKLLTVLVIVLLYQSCSQTKTSANSEDNKQRTQSSQNINKYVLTISKDKFDESKSKFMPDNSIDTVKEENDTVAYLAALKRFYNQKIEERKKFNYGQPKSFMIVDAKGIDLTIKLSDRVVNGLKTQVTSQPDVQQMLEAYQKDSTVTN